MISNGVSVTLCGMTQTCNVTSVRLIPRLDVKGPNLIKGVHLEGLRIVGEPHARAVQYYQQGADEILYMDIVASLYERNSLSHLIEQTVRDVFVPITVGGGIRSVDDAVRVLRSGADKVAVNTAAIRRPSLISEMAKRLGSQCVVLSIEAKRQEAHQWEAYTDNGRERTGLDAVQWARMGVELGAGEVLVTSIDREGTRSGFDVSLVQAITNQVGVPVIASGGMGSLDHLKEVVTQGHANAVAMADVLHYDRITLPAIREGAAAAGIVVRNL